MKKALLASLAMLLLAACGTAPSPGLGSQAEQALSAQRLSVPDCQRRLRPEIQLFEQTDRNKDRFITRDEARLTAFANRNFSAYDRNEDDRVSFSEFLKPAEESLCQ